jgi:hypothetical protein
MGGELIVADRSAINRALSKSLAYSNVGKQAEANAWAAHLVALLGAEGILAAGHSGAEPVK